ncbi:spermidine/putrescine ABC transporter substrate-binding protein [filamentous cyanobacterium LEGE 07170]|nr:spermidine/putrescine ABC transporter substrate-binding protein [filamentous cyanobacterium LEGE 07170]
MSPGRRRFLQLSTAAMAGAVLTNCAGNIAQNDADSTDTEAEATASNEGSASGDDTLHIYSWSSYFDDDMIAGFEEATGIRVVADIYDSNETMLARLQAGGGGQYSIIYPSDYMIEQMIEMDMLLELDHDELPDLADLIEQWQSPPYDPGNDYSIPYSWGTTGLIYNVAELGEVEDWEYLWENQEELTRRMTLLNDVREVAGITLKMLGYSNSTEDAAEVEEAFAMLEELKPALSAFTTDGWRDQIVPGDLLIAHAYSVDALDAIAENDDLEYVVPSSGATVWTDGIAIPTTAPNVEAAYAWMNYVLNPESAAEVMSRLQLATPNKLTLDSLDSELKADTRLFPPEEVLAKCEALAPVGDAIDLYDRLWTQLTST